MVIFRNKVDIFLTANASVKPKDQQRLNKNKKNNALQFNPQHQMAIRGYQERMWAFSRGDLFGKKN